MVARVIEVTRRGRKGEQGNPGSTVFDAVTTAGSSTVYTLTNGTPIISYADGYGVTIDAHVTNGAAPTMNVDGLGAVPIKKLSGGSSVAIEVGDMVADNFYMIHYSSVESAFILFGTDINVVKDLTPQLGGPLSANSHQINESKGADVASAAALTLGADGNFFDITGTTSITSIVTRGVGTEVTLQFDDILTLTHHAIDLILPNGQNITTYAGYVLTLREYASGDWIVVSASASSSGWEFVENTYDFSVDGVVGSIESADFADGYEYRFSFLDLTGSGLSTDWRVEAYKETDAAYLSPPALISPTTGSAGDDLFGFLELKFSRLITNEKYYTFGANEDANASPTSDGVIEFDGSIKYQFDGGMFIFGTAQKIGKVRFSRDNGNIDGGKIPMYRKAI